MNDVETLIIARLTSIEATLKDLTDFKSKIIGIVMAISGVGTICGSIILAVTNHYWK